MNEREHKIVNSLETYFSDASLLWDKVMVSKIIKDPEGMVSIEELCKLPKLRSIQVTPQELLEAAEKHSTARLKINEDKTKIGRIKPYVHNKKEELDDYSIYVEGLAKPYVQEQAIRELFNTLVGHVSFFRIPPNQHGKQQFFGYCFIEFDDKNNVQKAIDLLNTYPKRKNTVQLENEEKQKLLDKLSLRVMSKTEWNKLKEEYVQLLTERKAHIKALWDEYKKEEEEKPDTNMIEAVEVEEKEKVEEKGYTEGLIVFVENLHPASPKTTAIALLETSGVSIAFMNVKKKGLTTTHIRLKSPEDAKAITEYFTQHHIVQETDKDKTGKEMDTQTFDCIKLRVITGSEEKIYWENDKRK